MTKENELREVIKELVDLMERSDQEEFGEDVKPVTNGEWFGANKQPDIVLICPVCKKQFTRTRSKLRGRRHKIKTQSITCSRQCGAIFGHMHRRN